MGVLEAKSHTYSETSSPDLIVKPVDGASVDAAYATFEWKRVEGADGYRFELAEDETFAHVTVDASVGETTSLTLFESVPADGRLRYARVKALESGRTIAVSATTTFRPVNSTDIHQELRPNAIAARSTSTSFQGEPPVVDVHTAPWRTASTSAVDVAVIMGVMILTLVSFGLMMLL